MDLRGQREADLKCICGFVKRGHKDRNNVWFCVLGTQLKAVPVPPGGCEQRMGAGAVMQVLIHGRIEFLEMCSTSSLAGMRLDISGWECLLIFDAFCAVSVQLTQCACMCVRTCTHAHSEAEVK